MDHTLFMRSILVVRSLISSVRQYGGTCRCCEARSIFGDVTLLSGTRRRLTAGIPSPDELPVEVCQPEQTSATNMDVYKLLVVLSVFVFTLLKQSEYLHPFV